MPKLERFEKGAAMYMLVWGSKQVDFVCISRDEMVIPLSLP
jgi:hypothetical protein